MPAAAGPGGFAAAASGLPPHCTPDGVVGGHPYVRAPPRGRSHRRGSRRGRWRQPRHPPHESVDSRRVGRSAVPPERGARRPWRRPRPHPTPCGVGARASAATSRRGWGSTQVGSPGGAADGGHVRRGGGGRTGTPPTIAVATPPPPWRGPPCWCLHSTRLPGCIGCHWRRAACKGLPPRTPPPDARGRCRGEEQEDLRVV